jgi:hypothetical protein
MKHGQGGRGHEMVHEGAAGVDSAAHRVHSWKKGVFLGMACSDAMMERGLRWRY